MQSVDDEGYWSLVRKRAWPHDKYDWFQSMGVFFVGTCLLWQALGRDRALEELESSLIWGAASAMVFAAFLVLRMGRAARVLHDEGKAERADLRSKSDEWMRIATDKRKSEQVVQQLLPALKIGVHALANRPQVSTNLAFTNWLADITKWEGETRTLLETAGCLQSEVSSFWDYTVADLDRAFGKLHDDPSLNRHFQRIQWRVNALRRIVNGYSDRPVFPE